jgi:hypothetical protein
MYSFVAFLALAGTILSIIFAIKGKHQLYWSAALCIYLFSLLAGFSIGQLTVGLTFVCMSLAIGYTLKLINNRFHQAAFLLLGIVIGLFMVVFVDDSVIFFPFTFFI